MVARSGHPTRPDPGIDRGQDDVGDVERAEGPLLEQRLELIAVPGSPARRMMRASTRTSVHNVCASAASFRTAIRY